MRVHRWPAALALIAAGACDRKLEDSSSFRQDQYDKQYESITVDEGNGRLAIYSGFWVAQRLARGEDIEGPASTETWLRVRMPASYVAEAKASPHRRKIISLEQLDRTVEITVHEGDECSVAEVKGAFRLTRMINRTIRPGDPPLSGLAGVLVRSDDSLTAVLRIDNGRQTSSIGYFGCSGEDCPRLMGRLGADAGALVCR